LSLHFGQAKFVEDGLGKGGGYLGVEGTVEEGFVETLAQVVQVAFVVGDGAGEFDGFGRDLGGLVASLLGVEDKLALGGRLDWMMPALVFGIERREKAAGIEDEFLI